MNTIIEYAFSVPEISYRIFQSNHPYYMRSIYATNNTLLQQCNSNKYEILQGWVYPELNVNQIRKKLPIITFADVVDLALVYNPIPESINYYDYYTLFFHACKQNQPYPEHYIFKLGNPQDISKYRDINTFLWICYKFNRIDIIDRWLNIPELDDRVMELFNKIRSILLAKLDNNYSTNIGFIITGTFCKLLDLSMMFTHNELLEVLIIISKLTRNVGKKPIDYILGTNTVPIDRNNVISKFTVSLAHHMNKQDMLKVISKYYPDVKTMPDIKYPTFDISESPLFSYENRSTLPKLYFKQDTWVNRYITKANAGIYYVTSGLYVDYINWKREGHTISKPDNTTNLLEFHNRYKYYYFSVAAWGRLSFNTDLCKAYDIPIDYYNIGKRKKNLPRLPNAQIDKTF